MAVVATSPSGRKMYKFKNLAYFAKDGIIVMHDERDGSVVKFGPADGLLRARAMGEESKRCIYADERKELEEAGNDMDACAAEAAAQGSPFDERAMEYFRLHKTLSVKKFTVGPSGASAPEPAAQPYKLVVGGGSAPPPSQLLNGGRLVVPGGVA